MKPGDYWKSDKAESEASAPSRDWGAGDRITIEENYLPKCLGSPNGVVQSTESGELVILMDSGETVRLPLAALKAVGE